MRPLLEMGILHKEGLFRGKTVGAPQFMLLNLIATYELVLNCQTGQNQPNSQILFHKNSSSQDFFRRSLVMTLLRSALPVNSQNKFKSQVTTIGQHWPCSTARDIQTSATLQTQYYKHFCLTKNMFYYSQVSNRRVYHLLIFRTLSILPTVI